MSDAGTEFVPIPNNVAEHVMNLEILQFQVDVLPDVLKYFVNLSNLQQNVPTLAMGLILVSDAETEFVPIPSNVVGHVMNLEILQFQVDVLPDVLKYFVNLSNLQQNVPTLAVGLTLVKQVRFFFSLMF